MPFELNFRTYLIVLPLVFLAALVDAVGGGGGKMSNMVIGVFVIGLLNYGMNFLNINSYWQKVVLGIALLAAVSMDIIQTRAAIKRAKKVQGAPAEA